MTIKKILAKILVKIANRLSGNEQFISDKYLRVLPWLRDKGDETHSLNHPLNENSVVFDLGGYIGEWSVDIFKKYNCYIHVFEPVNTYYLEIQKVLPSPKVKVNQYGLAQKTFTTSINISAEASSVFKTGGQQENIHLVNFMDYVRENKIEKIDLMKINIEGGEYDLLEYLVKTDFITKIHNIQVQFHDFFPDSEKRMKAIQQNLSATHQLTFHYPFIWENWRLKTASL